MAIKVILKNSQSEFVNTGFLFQGTYYVDNSHVTGLKSGFFCAIKGDGKSKCLANGSEDQATLTYAGCSHNLYADEEDDDGNKWNSEILPPRKADGIIYKQTPINRYRRLDNFENEERLYPYSSREDVAIGLLKKGVLEISDTENPKAKYFNTHDRQITIIRVSKLGRLAGNTCGTDVPHGLHEGARVKIGNIETHITAVADPKSFHTADEVKQGVCIAHSQIGDPVFLAQGMDKNTPFTAVPENRPEHIRQVVGYIESSNAVRIDLTADLNPLVNPPKNNI